MLTNPIHGGSALMTSSSPRSPNSKYHYAGDEGFGVYVFRGHRHTNIQSITGALSLRERDLSKDTQPGHVEPGPGPDLVLLHLLCDGWVGCCHLPSEIWPTALLPSGGLGDSLAYRWPPLAFTSPSCHVRLPLCPKSPFDKAMVTLVQGPPE